MQTSDLDLHEYYFFGPEVPLSSFLSLKGEDDLILAKDDQTYSGPMCTRENSA